MDDIPDEPLAMVNYSRPRAQQVVTAWGTIISTDADSGYEIRELNIKY